MSHGCTACFKHLMRNCKCTSPKKISLGYRTRVPEAGNVKKWKAFVKHLAHGQERNPAWLNDLRESIKGTKLENIIK